MSHHKVLFRNYCRDLWRQAFYRKAYIAGISSEQNRAEFGLIGAAFGLGVVLGPTLEALLATWGIRAPFYPAAALCLLNCIYDYFLLPEYLIENNRRPFYWKRANPISSLKFLRSHPEFEGHRCNP